MVKNSPVIIFDTALLASWLEERTVLSMARDICQELGVDADDSNLEFVPDRAFNDRRYFIDCSKLIALGGAVQADPSLKAPNFKV